MKEEMKMILIESKTDNTPAIRRSVPSLFDDNGWKSLCDIGLITNRIRLAHCGAIHYANYLSLPTQREKVRRTLSILSNCYEDNKGLKFRAVRDSDEKKELGEILGTAVGIEAICSVSDKIKTANFEKVPRPSHKKGPDYEIRVTDHPIITIEVKGMQSARLKIAQKACRTQLSNSLPPKYSIITKMTFDNKHRCMFFLSDPEVPENVCSKKQELVTVLKHYTRCFWWSGFYQFAEILVQRIREIENASEFSMYNNSGLADRLIRKMARGYKFGYQNLDETLITSVPADLLESAAHNDIHIKADHYELGFAIVERLYNILVKQDFDEILGFKEASRTIEYDDNLKVDVLSDGSVLFVKQLGE